MAPTVTTALLIEHLRDVVEREIPIRESPPLNPCHCTYRRKWPVSVFNNFQFEIFNSRRMKRAKIQHAEVRNDPGWKVDARQPTAPPFKSICPVHLLIKRILAVAPTGGRSVTHLFCSSSFSWRSWPSSVRMERSALPSEPIWLRRSCSTWRLACRSAFNFFTSCSNLSSGEEDMCWQATRSARGVKVQQ